MKLVLEPVPAITTLRFDAMYAVVNGIPKIVAVFEDRLIAEGYADYRRNKFGENAVVQLVKEITQ